MALDYKTIGERLKKARLSKKLTQEDVSEKMDLSVAFLSRIECGTAFINLKRLDELCTILGVSKGYILDGTCSINVSSYLDIEFLELLKNCPPEKHRMIYDIAKIIAENLYCRLYFTICLFCAKI